MTTRVSDMDHRYIPILRFLNPVHTGDVNTTIRLGRKWAWLQPGDIVDLAETGGEVTQSAELTFTHVCRFSHVPSWILDDEHDATCRTYLGAKTAMERAYGDEFTEGSTVTCIGYIPMTAKCCCSRPPRESQL